MGFVFNVQDCPDLPLPLPLLQSNLIPPLPPLPPPSPTSYPPPPQSNLIRSVDPELCHLTALVALSLEGNPVQFR